MRDNDLLDGAWDAPEAPKPAPKEWKRKSCRELDALMGVDSGDYDDDIFIAKPITKPISTGSKSTSPKSTKRRKRKAKATKVKPEDARKLLELWVKKLLLARKKVQKYRQAVKRYEKQGRL